MLEEVEVYLQFQEDLPMVVIVVEDLAVEEMVVTIQVKMVQQILVVVELVLQLEEQEVEMADQV
jgi:hypothetical protein